MISDSIPNASIAMASSNHKDIAKKKRANRSARLKQCKLDARREQWLSQVKNKGGCKEDVNGRSGALGGSLVQLESERIPQIEKLEIKPGGDEIYGDGASMHHFSYCDSSPSNSPTSHNGSLLGSNDSGVNFTASSKSNSSSSGRSTSSSSNGCCSGSMSEEDEEDVGDDGCLDDWEAVADALAATDSKHKEHSPSSGYGSPSSKKQENVIQSDSQLNTSNLPFSGVDISYTRPKTGGMAVQRAPVNCQAWRSDDAFRPQSLPNLSKQYSFPLNSERRVGRGGSVWDCKKVVPVPTSCPICYEDLDCTDSSFLPCSCGFMLCLFCHKRILEEDGRCPGCRKHYNFDPVEGEATLDGGSLTFRLARSCSMITRS